LVITTEKKILANFSKRQVVKAIGLALRIKCKLINQVSERTEIGGFGMQSGKLDNVMTCIICIMSSYSFTQGFD
jgi:hypothetical protein